MGKPARLVKLAELPNAQVPNNIQEGEVFEGELECENIKQVLIIGDTFRLKWSISTSPIVEIIDERTFRTRNSIYRIIMPDEIPKPKPFLKWQY